MQHAILCDGPQYRLERWGFGTSYALTHKPSGKSVHVQGDDAAQFDDDFLNCERHFPNNTTEQNAAWLWDQCDYGSASQ